MSNLRRSRELALQMLFQLDCGGVTLSDLENFFLSSISEKEKVKMRAWNSVKQTWLHLQDIDRQLRRITENWELSRMAAIDRNVLRLAASEIFYDPSIPKSVSINEAIEIAKKFSTDESGKFVNGVLDQLEKQ
jgi:transcription antitermination factor NusB